MLTWQRTVNWGQDCLLVLYSAYVRSTELIGSWRTNREGEQTRKKPMESAVKGDQKSF